MTTTPFSSEQMESRHSPAGMGRRQRLRPMDVMFGGYCFLMALVMVWVWWSNMSSVWSVAVFVAFLLVNVGISRLTARATVAQRQAEAKFRTVVEAAADAITIITPEGAILYTNPAHTRILGYSFAELEGQPFTPLIHPEDLAEAFATFRQLLEEPGVTTTAQVRTRHKDGSWRLIEGVARRLPDGNLVVHNRDITESKRIEEELRRLNEELEERVAQRTAESKRLAAIIETAPDYVGIADLNGWSLYVNQAGRRMVGKSDEAYASPWHVSGCYPAHMQPELQEMVETALRGEIWSGEVALLRQDGQEFPVAEVTFPLRDADGNIESLATIIRDISAQKQAEVELKQAKEAAEQALAAQKRLVEIIEATSDLVGTADVNGRLVYFNQAGRRFMGWDENDLNVKTIADIYPAHALAQVQAAIAHTLASGQETINFETAVYNAQDQEVPVSVVGINHQTSDGRTLLSAILRDISEHKRIEGELKQAKETAEAANKAKSTFLANMSHEIRTPMNAVIGMTGLLLNTPLNPRQHDFVETIRSSGDALLTIINDILDFSKIEAGKLDLESQPFDLRQCIESALDLLANKAGEKGIELAYEMGENVPAAIVGDVTRLRQILVNLISNAIKFTEQGEVVLMCQALPDTSTLHFAVRDTGIGIQPDKLGRLFQAFSQIDPSTTREYGGTGLGLAISKRLAELMGGRMWAESEGPGRGATFHFTMTAITAVSTIPNRWHSRQPALTGKRILIVDDSATNRRILSLQTKAWGMIPVEAASPGAALALLDQGKRFDLGILDVHMPEMDGVELAAALCQQHQQNGHHFPLILLTSLGYENRPELEAVECFAAYLTKPVKPSPLYDVLIQALHESYGDEAEQIAAAPQSPNYSITQLPASPLPLRILLAEDVAVNQKFALLALEEMGYTADVAANGLEVLEAMARQSYDIILMDVQMPVMDGLEATRRIRHFDIEQPYIIAMTANAMQGDREMCLETGMDDYISKPVYLEELQAALARAQEAAGERVFV